MWEKQILSPNGVVRLNDEVEILIEVYNIQYQAYGKLDNLGKDVSDIKDILLRLEQSMSSLVQMMSAR